MTKRTRSPHCPGLKAEVALAAMKGEETLVELAKLFDVHSTQFAAWKARLQDGADGVFRSGPAASESAPVVDAMLLHAEIGGLELKKILFAGALSKANLLSATR